jgi:hypothetical protein
METYTSEPARVTHRWRDDDSRPTEASPKPDSHPNSECPSYGSKFDAKLKIIPMKLRDEFTNNPLPMSEQERRFRRFLYRVANEIVAEALTQDCRISM